MGAFLIAYVFFIIFSRTFKLSQKLSVAVSSGGLTGFFAGIFGIGGEINAVALSAFNLEKAVYVATAGAISFLIDSTRIAIYLRGGVRLESIFLSGFLLFIPASLIGATIGKKGVEKIPQEKFRNFIAFFIFRMILTEMMTKYWLVPNNTFTSILFFALGIMKHK